MSSNKDILSAFTNIQRASFVELNDHDQICGHSIPTTKWIDYVLKTVSPKSSDRVLHVGTGSGYIPALLSCLVEQVVSIEKSPVVAQAARDRFDKLQLDNIVVITGEGEGGAASGAPFDIVLVTTPSMTRLDHLFSQLSEHGRLFTIERDPTYKEVLVCYQSAEDGKFSRQELAPLPQHCDLHKALLNIDYIDESVLKRAQAIAKSENQPVIEAVRNLIDADEVEFYRRLASETGMVYRDLDSLVSEATPEFFAKFSRAFLDLLHIIPVACSSKMIILATYDPSADTSDLRKLYPHHDIQMVLVTLTSFRRLWSMFELCNQGDIKQFQHYQKDISGAEESESLRESSGNKVEAHLISVLDAILVDAASEKASDIHLEQYDREVRLRLRIDGELRDLTHYQLSQKEVQGLINIIKIRADMNIAEKRIPQGGRSQMVFGKTRYDLRIQIQPSLHGEDVVVRLLPQTGKVIGIEALGLNDHIARSYRRLLQNPSGLVLVVGPTGSGKSTTLYAGLQILADDPGRKVITVEDPIEYDIKNIQQTQVRPDIGFHFADAMRSFVRLDPDVILIGEIRDHETAQEALRASQTGHLVLSTLHCNDATDAQQRLFDLNAHPNSIASELTAVIAQRLAKRICPDCKQEVKPDPVIMKELFPNEVPSRFKTFAGKGCRSCHFRGTSGRVAVIEFLHVNNEIREAISRRASALELRTIAMDNGLVTMRDSALEHVINGVIPLSEIPRILSAERMAPGTQSTAQRLRAI